MENLVQLVHGLKSGEIQFIRDFYHTKFHGNSSKRQQLLELILKGKIQNNQDIARLLYQGKRSSAQSHLKNSLRNDILDLMVSNPAPEVEAEIHCRKQLLQSKILLSRGDTGRRRIPFKKNFQASRKV